LTQNVALFKLILKYFQGAFYIVAGVNHFINPVFYVNIMPPYVPWHRLFVDLTGILEVAFGIAILAPRYTRIAAWGLIFLLTAIFPANVHMATHQELYTDVSPTLLWIRLPLQGILIAWAYWYTRRDHAAHSNPTTI